MLHDSCTWWRSPIVISGTGGSGTRGAADLIGQSARFGVHLLGTSCNSTSRGCACPANHALDTNCNACTVGCVGGEWASCGEGSPDSLAAYVKGQPPSPRWLSLAELSDAPACAGEARTKGGVLRALASVPDASRAPYRWGWKMPATMFHLHAIRSAYPCARFVHVLRHPLDLAADVLAHVGNRAAETLRVARALGYRGISQGGAARFLCADDDACRALVGPVPPLVPVLPGSGTTTQYKREVQASPPLAAALQCMHLLLWSAANDLVLRWATRVGLVREGAMQPAADQTRAAAPSFL